MIPDDPRRPTPPGRRRAAHALEHLRAGGKAVSADGPLCSVCATAVTEAERPDAWVWTSPDNAVLIAHGQCLRALGEADLGLREEAR